MNRSGLTMVHSSSLFTRFKNAWNNILIVQLRRIDILKRPSGTECGAENFGYYERL